MLRQSINIENSLSDADARHVLQHANMACTAEIAGVQDSIAVDEQQLGPLVRRISPESVEQFRVDWHFFKRQKARHVWVVCGLDLMVLINDFHRLVVIHYDIRHSVLLVSLRVRDVDSGHALQRVWLAPLEDPVKLVHFDELLFEVILDLLPFFAHGLIHLTL